MKSLLVGGLLLFMLAEGLANNVTVTNVMLRDRTPDTQTTTIAFDVSWENSWRTDTEPFNWDAVWLFAKFRVDDGPWQHATISGPGRIPAGAVVDVPADGKGAFVYRSGSGYGNVSFSDLELLWEYGTDGVADAAVVTLRLLAIEMVYVPSGDYFLGSGGNGSGEFYERTLDVTDRPPYAVVSEDALSVGLNAGDLAYGLFPNGDVPEAFPKGHAGFYCMKYEASQRQYTDFFNLLEPTQQLYLDLGDQGAAVTTLQLARNGFHWIGYGSATTALPHVPVSWVSTAQILAYLDWSGLRPLTELEFEKACRGTAAPVVNEYAWGTAWAHAEAYEKDEDSTPNERVSNANHDGLTGNAVYVDNSDLTGPMRTGVFAASATAFDRAETGGTYYGIMELSGNLREFVISIGTAAGRAYAGGHGDGRLDAEGRADVADWPTSGAGCGSRGGSFADLAEELRVSDRTLADIAPLAGAATGFRGVRTAPINN